MTFCLFETPCIYIYIYDFLCHFGATCYLRLHESKVIEINQPNSQAKKPTETTRPRKSMSFRSLYAFLLTELTAGP